MIKKLSWTYGLGFGVVSVLILCVYSLFTISRATITTVALDNADQLKEVKTFSFGFTDFQTMLVTCTDGDAVDAACVLVGGLRCSTSSYACSACCFVS